MAGSTSLENVKVIKIDRFNGVIAQMGTLARKPVNTAGTNQVEQCDRVAGSSPANTVKAPSTFPAPTAAHPPCPAPLEPPTCQIRR